MEKYIIFSANKMHQKAVKNGIPAKNTIIILNIEIIIKQNKKHFIKKKKGFN